MLSGECPDRRIVCTFKSDVADVRRVGKVGLDGSHDAMGRILREPQLHAGMLKSRRSRSAAKARQARISWLRKSGKSPRISVSDIPPARYSSIS
jgi:hypothetical protein